MKRIIITGGTGLIGRALAADMARANDDVIVLSRDPNQARDLPNGVRAEKWDGRTGQGWSALIDAETVIVNLAGASIGIPPLPWTPARKQLIRDSRVNAGRAVVDAIRAAKVKPAVLVQSSAVGYYGLHGDEPITEQSGAGQDFLAQVGVAWEAATAEVEALGVRRVIVRTGVVLNEKGGVLSLLALPFRFFVGGPIGSGKQYLPWIHIADEVGAIRFLIETESARGAYNVSAPTPLTNAEFGRVLGHVMHRPAFVPVPGFVMKLALGEMAELLLLGGQRAVPQRLQQAGYVFKFADAQLALSNLLR